MDTSTKPVDQTPSVVDQPIVGSTTHVADASDARGTDIGGGWVVNAKDGSELSNGFASKKDASKWASLEVENKRLKAGQYKIAKVK